MNDQTAALPETVRPTPLRGVGSGDGFGVPTVAGYYWFTGTYGSRGQWRLVEVFRPCWCDPTRQDLRWRYLDRSGGEDSESDVATCAGEWSAQVLPPSSPNDRGEPRH